MVGAAALLATGVQPASAAQGHSAVSLKAAGQVGRFEQFKSVRSPDGTVTFGFNASGQLTVIHNGRTTWSSKSRNVTGAVAFFGDTGHLGIYNDKQSLPYWSSETDGRVRDKGGADVLKVQNDGNVVLYRGTASTWDTATNGK